MTVVTTTRSLTLCFVYATIQSVEKRVKEGASEIDAKEWDNVSSFEILSI